MDNFLKKYVQIAMTNWKPFIFSSNSHLQKESSSPLTFSTIKLFIFRAQLIQKQQQLEEMLLEMTTETLQQNEGEENHFEVIIEEHLETDEEEIVEEDYYVSSDNSCGPFDENEDEIVEVISLPSLKHLRSTDNKSIINLINKIEEKNELILQVSTPPTVKRKVQSSSSKPKTSANQVAVPRKEDLKFEEPKPKIILQPTTSSTPTTLQSSEKHRVKRLPKPLEVPLTCCEQTFTMKLKFREHLKNYHPRPLQCSHCGKILRNRKTFLVHGKSHQNFADRRFKCSYENCEKAFNFKLHLNNHERTHSGKSRRVISQMIIY